MIRRLALSTFFALAFAGASFAQSFPGQIAYGGTAGGSANALSLTIPNVGAYTDLVGVPINFVPAANNTGSFTINIDAIGAQTVERADGTATQANDLIAGVPATLLEIGTQFYLPNVSTSNSVSNSVGFASSTTWTVPAHVNILKSIECWGGGGGGGGSSGTGLGGQGGGGGGYALGNNFAVTPGAGLTVSIGVGGLAGSTAGGTGGTGGTSLFGGLMGASGGTGGTGNGGSPGTGGTGSGGGVNITGATGSDSFAVGATNVMGGSGGPAPFGGGIAPPNISGSGGAGVGQPGIFPGGAGNGGASLNGGTAVAGGAGAPGYCRISY